jgi:steroid delta-isomerase-like uncharacterized protein
MTETVREFRAAFPDLHMSFEDRIPDHGRVVTRWIARGTHRGELDGIAATGRAAQVSGVYIHRLADGQITDSWTSYDRFGLLCQLGIIPAGGPA